MQRADRSPRTLQDVAHCWRWADTRVWFHASQFRKAIIYSPDSDTFMIGLSLIEDANHSPHPHTEVVVRLDTPGAKERLYLDVNMLVDCIKRDPDLACIPQHKRAAAVQAVYVASGCDYTSFFAGVGKATFYKALFHHAPFTCGGVGAL